MSGRHALRKTETIGWAPTWERWVDKKLVGYGLVGKTFSMGLRSKRRPFVCPVDNINNFRLNLSGICHFIIAIYE